MQQRATRIFRNRIAYVFDFDGTLAPGTFEAVVSSCGYDPETLKRERLRPMIEERRWEQVLARGYILVQLGREGKLTREVMQEVGRELPLFNGVKEMFSGLRELANSLIDAVEVEFYLITAGFATVPKANPIAREFNEIFSGALHFDEEGRPAFVKRVITHPEKPRYILHIAKGLKLDTANPEGAFAEVEDEDWHIPVDQIVYVGDGASDMPAFELVRERGGIAIGVFESETAEEWDGRDLVSSSRRVENLAGNDYSEDSELMRSLKLATESVCNRIALRRLGAGE